jgi:preprotein translocase subunit SecE
MGPHGSRAVVMGKDKGPASNGWNGGWMHVLGELLRTEIYKRSQGRIVRQVTFFAIWLAFALAGWRLHYYVGVVFPSIHPATPYVVLVAMVLAGFWIAFRIVNLAAFADFLIAVEAEMNKVSWPTRAELIRASIVVIVLMFGLTMVLFTYDNILVLVFQWLGIT